jgi:hypothetical protein
MQKVISIAIQSHIFPLEQISCDDPVLEQEQKKYFIFHLALRIPEPLNYILDVQLCVPLGIYKLWRSETGHFPNCRTRDQSRHLLEWRSGIWPGPLYPRAGTDQALGPPEPTATGPGLTQPKRLALWVRTAPTFMLCTPPSIFDVGLNPTISPVTHWAQLFHHKHPHDLPKMLSRP